MFPSLRLLRMPQSRSTFKCLETVGWAKPTVGTISQAHFSPALKKSSIFNLLGSPSASNTVDLKLIILIGSIALTLYSASAINYIDFAGRCPCGRHAETLSGNGTSKIPILLPPLLPWILLPLQRHLQVRSSGIPQLPW